MDTRKIKKLIELVKATGIGELEVKSGDESVRINCQALPSQPATGASPTVMHIAAEAPAPTPPPAASPSSEAAAPAADGHTLQSPMVGTVYLAATPGDPPFVKVGDRVSEGTTLCLIEAMKMFNKIEADISGKISARLIENEQPVEFDQPLFIIEPDK